MTPARPPDCVRLVMAGADGSPSSLEAVETAAHEAELRRCALRLVHAFFWPAMHPPPGPSPLGPPDGGLREMVGRVVAEAVQRARTAAPDVETTNAVIAGEPLSVLERQSRTAELIVVGSRGLGGFAGLLLGSTAVHLAAHSHCPVMVVRGRKDPAGDVLLGADGSPAGRAAVGFAFAEASLRRAHLIAVHAWPPKTERALGPQDPLASVFDEDRLHDGAARQLSEALAGWQEKYPDVLVHRRLVKAGPREALIRASGSAQLVVVGARGRGGVSGLLLGSVSQALLHHAQCPVTVVRGTGEQ
ncbi:universal stress protein [Streptomyces sp. NPDC057438]|uniref:universal stress protein n=1 Tax=Streptomyces sp. NPDC057438 TaxID=3346133 RepID=UPI003674951C